jgi:hypothetical protein
MDVNSPAHSDTRDKNPTSNRPLTTSTPRHRILHPTKSAARAVGASVGWCGLPYPLSRGSACRGWGRCWCCVGRCRVTGQWCGWWTGGGYLRGGWGGHHAPGRAPSAVGGEGSSSAGSIEPEESLVPDGLTQRSSVSRCAGNVLFSTSPKTVSQKGRGDTQPRCARSRLDGSGFPPECFLATSTPSHSYLRVRCCTHDVHSGHHRAVSTL